MANIAVHADSRSNNFSLSGGSKKLIPAGPSIYGMADPGHLTAVSLLNVNIALLLTKPSITSLALLQTIKIFVDRIGEAFIKTHDKNINTTK